MTHPNVHQINWFLSAGTLRAAFTRDKRTDGSTFWCLTDQAHQNDEELTPWLMGLHDEELPNDWRYETIVSILDALMEIDGRLADYDDHTDLISGIVDNLTDIYNHSLFQWYADIPSRVGYIEEGVLSGIITPETDTIARLMIGQTVCIEQMAFRIVDRLLEGK